jgi:tRNA modification GTPase
MVLQRDRVFEPVSRQAYRVILCDPQTDETLDEAVWLFFASPRSYTRQDVVELSCHGSPYILRRVVDCLVRLGARPAEPGEFTLRAHLNGALDLAQAEAVADLIQAQTQAAHQLAYRQLRGGLSTLLRTLRQELVDFAALLELELDFSEEDVEFANRADLRGRVVHTRHLIQELLAGFSTGQAVREGFPVAIVGRPNAGKSTLLNALVREERAIVSPIPGTTRDTIEEGLIIGGHLFRFIDTAGLRDTPDPIEREGVRRSGQKARQAALVCFLFDLTDSQAIAARSTDLSALNLPPETEVWFIGTKADLVPPVQDPAVASSGDYVISAATGLGLECLTRRLADWAGAQVQASPVALNARHAYLLEKADQALERVLEGLASHQAVQFIALELRLALEAIGTITGEVTNDDILGSIFTRFCIGK